MTGQKSTPALRTMPPKPEHLDSTEQTRINAEQQRQESEDARVSAEDERASGEVERRTSESARKEGEAFRRVNEQMRSAAEDMRAAADDAPDQPEGDQPQQQRARQPVPVHRPGFRAPPGKAEKGDEQPVKQARRQVPDADRGGGAHYRTFAANEVHRAPALTGPPPSNWQVPQPDWLVAVKNAQAEQLLPVTFEVST